MNRIERFSSIRFALLGLFLAPLLTGCFQGFVKSEPAPATTSKAVAQCELLERNNEWLALSDQASTKYGTPVYLILSLLEEPLSDHDKKHVRARQSDWDEFRLRNEQWDAAEDDPTAAVSFIAWYARESNQRNKLTWNDSSAHYLALRLGHGGYHRFNAEHFPELIAQSERVKERANEWQAVLQSCGGVRSKSGWLDKLKAW